MGAAAPFWIDAVDAALIDSAHATKAGCSGHDNKRRAIAGFARPYIFKHSPTVQTLGLFAFAHDHIHDDCRHPAMGALQL